MSKLISCLFRNSGIIFFLLLGVCFGQSLRAQSFEVSETSSKFLSESDYDSLIRAVAMPMAKRSNITQEDFNARYSNYRSQFAELFVPLLQQRFAVLDKTYQRISNGAAPAMFAKARSQYSKEVMDVVDMVMTRTRRFAGLFEPDNSDRILSFHSDITVMTSGKMLVKETIVIFNGNGQYTPTAEGMIPSNDDIQRGIVREFPTRYKDSAGFWSNTGFTLKGVFKNGEKEPFLTENLYNGVRIMVGRKELILQPGVYTYQLDYETDRQLIFHRDKDELYWNVNGNGWVFTADSISCTIHFPEGASIGEYACYTGALGATEKECGAKISGNSIIGFSSTRRFKSYEGLTVAAAIQKGIVSPPGKFADTMAFLRSNYVIPALSLLFLFLFGFYFYIWNRKGRDPEKGVIYPRFSPPDQLTPADAGYILEQQFGSHLFAAALVDCAVKKFLTIEVSRKGLLFKSFVYQFKKPEGLETSPSVSAEYGFHLHTLYGQKAEKGVYNSTLKTAYQALESILKERFLIRKGKTNKWGGLFALNKGYTRFGGVVVIGALVLAIQFLVTHPSVILLLISGSLALAMIILHFVFARIMSAYSQQGREIVDHLLGFKMYLETAEQRVYDQLTPPEKTLELFEKYLPYAIALTVENAWASKFDDIVKLAIERGYQPAYYGLGHGGFTGFSMADMSRGISSGLSGTISSASTPPSSSSGGSGGGGSSGGGGGGGGGGGW